MMTGSGRWKAERRISMILKSLIGDDKTTIEISKAVPFEVASIKNTLVNLKSKG